ncbi:hypothetical protein H106_02743 [Trichophyton rubrum CBS 735.88]|nr:hypothetical protein H102_02902 [Trichophyton rubrum CBS 100081]EZG07968.1 hypothetical protein H106_02743 [Trichophyton rubrum CBS 735.88]
MPKISRMGPSDTRPYSKMYSGTPNSCSYKPRPIASREAFSPGPQGLAQPLTLLTPGSKNTPSRPEMIVGLQRRRYRGSLKSNITARAIGCWKQWNKRRQIVEAMELDVGVTMDIRRTKAIQTGPDRNQSKMYGNRGSSVAFFSL